MPQPWVDIAPLSSSWDAAIGSRVPPLGSGLRSALPDRWVRFHTLPGSERIAATPAQRGEVVHRYETVLAALRADAEQTLLVTTCGWGPTMPAPRVPELAELMPGAPWQSVPPGEDEDLITTVYVTLIDPVSDRDSLAELLLGWVADDRAADVVIAPPSWDWLVHPYDGGMDVIARDQAELLRLRSRFSDWISPLPSGL